MSTPAAASLVDDFAHLLHLTAHDWRTALDRRLRPLGLSRATWMLLAWVRKLDAPSQTVLADRRVKTIHLTGKGEALSAEIHRVAAAMRREVFAGIGERDLDVARSVLQRLHDRVGASA